MHGCNRLLVLIIIQKQIVTEERTETTSSGFFTYAFVFETTCAMLTAMVILLYNSLKTVFIYIYIYIPSADMHVSAFTPRQCSFVTHLDT